MPACVACHTSKVKCRRSSTTSSSSTTSNGEAQGSCPRCLRLKIPCIPHVSMQGKIKSTNQNHQREPKRLRRSDSTTEQQLLRNSRPLPSKNLQFHFGTNHIIRQWFVLAFARKSFRLLEAATKLANQTNIGMEQILQGTNLPDQWFSNGDSNNNSSNSNNNSQRRSITMTTTTTTNMGCSPWMIMDPRTDADLPLSTTTTTTTTAQLTASDIPAVIWQTMRCSSRQGATNLCHDDPAVHHRWILVRETNHDQVRWFVSRRFSRDIATLETIQQTWQENQREVKDLWTVKPDFDKAYNQNFVHLVQSYVERDSHPPPIRSNATKIRLKDGQHLMVDFIQYFRIIHLDLSYMVTEFIPPRDFISPFASQILKGTAESNESDDDDEDGAEKASSLFLDNFEDLVYVDPLPYDPDLEWLGKLIFDDASSPVDDDNDFE